MDRRDALKLLAATPALVALPAVAQPLSLKWPYPLVPETLEGQPFPSAQFYFSSELAHPGFRLFFTLYGRNIWRQLYFVAGHNALQLLDSSSGPLRRFNFAMQRLSLEDRARVERVYGPCPRDHREFTRLVVEAGSSVKLIVPGVGSGHGLRNRTYPR
jgi:hypothetical protein